MWTIPLEPPAQGRPEGGLLTEMVFILWCWRALRTVKPESETGVGVADQGGQAGARRGQGPAFQPSHATWQPTPCRFISALSTADGPVRRG